MTLKSQYEADRDLMLSSELPWVQSVTYNGETVSASFQINSEESEDGRRESAELLVSTDDVPLPSYRDTVVVSGVTWYVLRVISGDTYSNRLELYRAEKPLARR